MAKQIKVTASELMKLTIWDSCEKLRSARGRGLITLIKENGKQYYDLNKIDIRFLTQKQTA